MRLSLGTRARAAVAAGAALTVLSGGVAAAVIIRLDPGQEIQKEINSEAGDWFGVFSGLPASSTADLDQAQALANPTGLVTLATGLKANVVSAGKSAATIDQMVLWPAARPTHLIACNEEGHDRPPALQKIDLVDRRGHHDRDRASNSCDPVRATPWGTVIFGEEAGDTGAMYEIIDPLAVDRRDHQPDAPAISSMPDQIRRVDALGFNSFEGLAVLPNGVTYYGNELSANAGADGGAYYKFVPTTPWAGGAPITLARPVPVRLRARSPPCGSAPTATTARASSTAPAAGVR